jgi:hypothetical protein
MMFDYFSKHHNTARAGKSPASASVDSLVVLAARLAEMVARAKKRR